MTCELSKEEVGKINSHLMDIECLFMGIQQLIDKGIDSDDEPQFEMIRAAVDRGRRFSNEVIKTLEEHEDKETT